jgi:hypothetical protein
VNESGLSQIVRQLITERIDSLVQLEVLLLLVRPGGGTWTAQAVSDALRINPGYAAGELTTLRARGLAAVAGDAIGGDPAYRYAPASPELDAAVQELVQAYADRRVAVVTFIFSKPVDKIQTFADAFRLRKGKSDG